MTSQEVVPADEALKQMLEGDLGMGDLGEPGGTPRIKIVHREGVFADSQTGAKVSSFDGVALGVIRQRVLWPPEMGEENEAPLCKSLDAVTARPNPKTFPLNESGLELVLDDGCEALCDDCKLSNWGSHPTRDTSWCTEQYVVPVMADFFGEGDYSPALVTFQKSGIKAVKTYLAGFKRRKQPAFAAYTTFSLNLNSRGQVDYSVPVLTQGDPTPQDLWGDYAQNFLVIDSYLRTWRDEDEADNSPAAVPADQQDIPEF